MDKKINFKKTMIKGGAIICKRAKRVKLIVKMLTLELKEQRLAINISMLRKKVKTKANFQYESFILKFIPYSHKRSVI